MNKLVNSKIKPQKAIDTTFCGFIDMEIFKIFCALSRFLTMQILPGLRHRDEEGENGADDGADPEDLQGCCEAPLVGTPADEGRDEAADGRR